MVTGFDAVRSARRYQPDEGVLWCNHAGIVIVLALRSGRYMALDEVASVVWLELCRDKTPDDIVADDRAMYLADSADAEARADIVALVDYFESSALLRPRQGEAVSSPETRPSERPRPVERLSDALDAGYEVPARIPSVLECCARLLLMRVGLRMLGFRRVLLLLWSWRRRDSNGRLSDAWLEGLIRHLSVARAICPIRTACLEQGLVTWLSLNRAGGDAQLRLGAHPYPFQAHAWVEHWGRAVVDNPDELLEYRLFPAIDFSRI